MTKTRLCGDALCRYKYIPEKRVTRDDTQHDIKRQRFLDIDSVAKDAHFLGFSAIDVPLQAHDTKVG